MYVYVLFEESTKVISWPHLNVLTMYGNHSCAQDNWFQSPSLSYLNFPNMHSRNWSNQAKLYQTTLYRSLKDLFGKEYSFNIIFAELIHSPLLASFPDMVDQSDLMDVLRVRIIWIFTKDKKKVMFCTRHMLSRIPTPRIRWHQSKTLAFSDHIRNSFTEKNSNTKEFSCSVLSYYSTEQDYRFHLCSVRI